MQKKQIFNMASFYIEVSEPIDFIMIEFSCNYCLLTITQFLPFFLSSEQFCGLASLGLRTKKKSLLRCIHIFVSTQQYSINISSTIDFSHKLGRLTVRYRMGYAFVKLNPPFVYLCSSKQSTHNLVFYIFEENHSHPHESII